ncbi:hypothetical protein M404DRAFT_992552 [Pisolithus tinctorius Marx 270]|uniref:Uncharacterized protein n=1 Tax=Pisolithus tinctorius Marx 270 TaxID=870435 RepID=A0A0C3PJF8_PISTI|nr:hypothetical protein M404DRAFT_992552 [Pisolithus tinctorius Marx 270]
MEATADRIHPSRSSASFPPSVCTSLTTCLCEHPQGSVAPGQFGRSVLGVNSDALLSTCGS